MNNDNLKNNLSDEQNFLSADERKICDLIGKLDRVECPKDFDFRLKARIANANGKDFQPSIWQTARYILPAAACVLIVAFVMVQGGMFSAESPATTTIAATNPNIQPFDSRSENAQKFTVSNPTEPVIAAVPNRSVQSNTFSNMDVSLKNPPESRVMRKVSPDDKSTMSRVLSVGQNRKPLNPNGFNPENIKPRVEENQNNKPADLSGFFDIAGLKTEFVGGKLRVKSVGENTMADKSGIKAGDFIEAVEDVKISQSGTNLQSNSIGKITISRSGQIIEITLRPN